MTDHSFFMHQAINLVVRFWPRTTPNPRVGSVIVSTGDEIIGEGIHWRAGEPHAERNAIADARQRGASLAGATIYVTLEPCNHTGRTGPCTEAIIEAGLSRVVIADRDPNPNAAGGIQRLREAGLEVIEHVERESARALNPGFYSVQEHGRPHVTLKWAMTLDGCTSLPNGDSKWITGEEARQRVHRDRSRADAVVAGIGTVLADQARLTARLRGASGPDERLVRVVLDSQLRLPPQAPFLQDSDISPACIICAEDAGEEQEKTLVDAGAQVVRAPRDETGGLSLAAFQKLCLDNHLHALYVEGGRRLHGSFLSARWVDRIHCWIAPKISGGSEGAHVGPVASNLIQEMSQAIPLGPLNASSVGGDVLLEGEINWPPSSETNPFR